MKRDVKPLTPGVEANLRQRLAHNPFFLFMVV